MTGPARQGKHVLEPDTEPTRASIDALTGLRSIAALWVVVFHIRFEILQVLPGLDFAEPVLDGGFMGVEVFFVLSGFIIAYNYADSMRSPSLRTYGRYLYMRLARIYPVHLAMIAAYLVAFTVAARIGVTMGEPVDHGWKGLLANLTVLQGLPLDGNRLAWNGASWTITYELFAYLALPVLAAFVWSMRRSSTLVLVAAVSVAFTLVSLFALASAGVDISKDHVAGIFRISGEFIAGMVLCRLYRLRRAPALNGDLLTIGAVVAGAVVIYAVSGLQEDSAFLTLPLVVLGIFGLARASGPVARVLSSRVAMYGGVTSYSLYMTHPLTMIAMRRALPAGQWDDKTLVLRIAMVVGYLVAALVIGAVMYHLVEKPARIWMRRLLGRRRPPTEIAAVEASSAHASESASGSDTASNPSSPPARSSRAGQAP